MKLTNPTDDELNVAFAEKVAGWKRDPCGYWEDEHGKTHLDFAEDEPAEPCFTRSADAVLPWLNKTFCVWSYHPDHPKGHLFCDIDRDLMRLIEAHGEFPLAAVIALLRAKGAEVEFTEDRA